MSSEGNEDQPRKIIIDEDWKSQVEQEREHLKSEPDEQSPDSPSQPSAEQAPQAPGPEQIPEASFPLLVTTLATQAMAAMGQIPDPHENKPVIHLEIARHYIDTLAMLEEKTKGNLDAEEAPMLEQVIHQLRLLFVAVQTPGA